MCVVQEKRFYYKGFPCVILLMSWKYRCGYVGLPKDTKVNTDEILCHGGITYSGNELHHQTDTDKLWIGFDCNHYMDIHNPKPLEYCVEQCKEIVNQVIEMGVNT